MATTPVTDEQTASPMPRSSQVDVPVVGAAYEPLTTASEPPSRGSRHPEFSGTPGTQVEVFTVDCPVLVLASNTYRPP